LKVAYGSKQIKIDILIYDDTSMEFVENNKKQEVSTKKADLILFEPFLLNDNDGMVIIQDSLTHLSKIMKDVEKVNPDTTFLLQPSYPLYGATLYPKQVAELKKYAKENNITYLDHWKAWPDLSNPELKDYLLPGQNGPNEKGNEIWENYVLDYFISK
jgi:hypothetical protein